MRKTMLYEFKSDCCGCGACSCVCPSNIIDMEYDLEGFLYPQIKDNAKCVGCGMCEKVCPMRHFNEIDSHFSKAFAGWLSDGSCVKSASGGASYALAKSVISENGVVYGVQYTQDCKSAEYIRIKNINEIEKIRSSKYIQARKNDVYKDIISDLKSGKTVLFIGLPCDTFAVKKYTEKCNDKLITVSLICHGPTSEKVHASFCKEIEDKYHSEMTEMNVRFKMNGQWKPYYIRAFFKNGREYIKKFQSTCYDIAFQNFKRPSCSECRFKNNSFCADILIGDFHSAQKGTVEYNEGGVSTLLPLTDKGMALLNMICENFILFPVDLQRSIGQKAVHSSVKSTICRDKFSQVLTEKGLTKACQNRDVRKAKAITGKRRLIFFIKNKAYRLLRRFKLV